MKTTFFFCLLALATTTWACPNISGYYFQCRSSTGQQTGLEDVSITQAIQNRSSLYRLNAINQETQEREEMFYLADGRTYSQTHGHTLTQTSASCRQNILVINTIVSVNRQIVSNLNTLASKNGGLLRIASSGLSNGRLITDVLICE